MILSSYMAEESPPESTDAREWARVRRILHHALELAPPLRPGYLDEACEGDAGLRAEVESLLAASEKSALLDRTVPTSVLSTEIVDTMTAGRVIGHYRLVAKIGEGGMGAVYKAIDTRLDRPVALKVVSGASGDWKQERRFAREARAASALNHPNIVTIYEFDTQDGLDFIAMEYVQGTTLTELLEHRAVPLETMLDYARQAAGALAKAHAAGIVHRDLKPANIMVTAEGAVKVLDFGLAKLRKAAADPDATQTQALTMPGISVGTPAYMSPEQAKGEAEDARTDIFTFGIILYEIAYGRRPFHGRSTHATMYQIVYEEPSALGNVDPPVTPQLASLIARCLRKDRAERPQSMVEVASALAGMPAVADAPAVSAVTRRVSRRALAAAGGLGAVAIAAGLWSWNSAGRTLTWRIEAQKMRDGAPVSEPYAASPEDVFEAGWRFRVRVRSPQAGFLYLINEGPGERGERRLWVLYPGVPNAAALAPDQDGATGWYVFDPNPGTEKLWIVWADRPLNAIEQSLSGAGHGEVRDAAQAGTLQVLLAGMGKARPAGSSGDFQLRGTDGVLGNFVELRHR
jgi:serine/threonine protein kinase